MFTTISGNLVQGGQGGQGGDGSEGTSYSTPPPFEGGIGANGGNGGDGVAGGAGGRASGGGIELDGGSLNVSNSTLANNTAPGGAGGTGARPARVGMVSRAPTSSQAPAITAAVF